MVRFPSMGHGVLLAVALLVMLTLPLGRAHSKSKQAFGFLEGLQGCHKGKTVEGVGQLKQYLQKLGYLHYENGHGGDDKFDEHLESAVKTYQLNYHLKVTGSLDPQTVKAMMKPRCGVADIINGTTRMRSGMMKFPLSPHTVSYYTFFQGTPRWPPTQTQLSYSFDDSVEQVVGVDIVRPAVSSAFAKWAAVSNFTFSEGQPGSKTDIVIAFLGGDHSDGADFDGQGGVLAHAFAPTDGRLHYDADEKWSNNPDMNQYEFDLESLALHEIGHLLGLDHSDVPEAVMHSGIAPGAKIRELTEDDVQGIRALYNL